MIVIIKLAKYFIYHAFILLFIDSTSNKDMNCSNGLDAFTSDVSAPTINANNKDPFSVLQGNSTSNQPINQTTNQSDLFDFFSAANASAFDNTKTSVSANSTPQVS